MIKFIITAWIALILVGCGKSKGSFESIDASSERKAYESTQKEAQKAQLEVNQKNEETQMANHEVISATLAQERADAVALQKAQEKQKADAMLVQKALERQEAQEAQKRAEEATRLAKIEEAKRKQELLDAKEASRLATVARKKAELEKKQEELEARRREEAAAKAAAQKKKEQEAAARLEAEARKKAQEVALKRAEQKQKEADEAKAQAEQKAKEEAAAKQEAEARKQQALEAQRRAQEKKKEQEAAQKALEEKQKAQKEALAKLEAKKAEESAKKKAEAEEKQKAQEAQAKKKAEIAKAKKLEKEEAKQKADAEAKQKAEQEAQAKKKAQDAQNDAKKKMEAEKKQAEKDAKQKAQDDAKKKDQEEGAKKVLDFASLVHAYDAIDWGKEEKIEMHVANDTNYTKTGQYISSEIATKTQSHSDEREIVYVQKVPNAKRIRGYDEKIVSKATWNREKNEAKAAASVYHGRIYQKASQFKYPRPDEVVYDYCYLHTELAATEYKSDAMLLQVDALLKERSFIEGMVYKGYFTVSLRLASEADFSEDFKAKRFAYYIYREADMNLDFGWRTRVDSNYATYQKAFFEAKKQNSREALQKKIVVMQGQQEVPASHDTSHISYGIEHFFQGIVENHKNFVDNRVKNKSRR